MKQEQVTKVIIHSVGLMILTSIHHVYGAIIYNTPWRMHVLAVSIPVIIVTLVSWKLLDSASNKVRPFIFSLLMIVTIIPSAGLIGVFEGLYNHVLKNILFFSGLSVSSLHKLFPPPTYEMPNDLIFEITGVMQGLITIPLIVRTVRLMLSVLRANNTTPEVR